MRGQWLGNYTGGESGTAMVNIDETEQKFEGEAFLIPTESKILPSVAGFSTKNFKTTQSVEALVFPIDPRNGEMISPEETSRVLGKDYKHSSGAKVKLTARGAVLRIDAITDLGVEIRASLKRTRVSDKSKIPGKEMSWASFKGQMSRRNNASLLFRGQKKPWSLCTTFHRRGRFRMSEFTGKDVKQLHQRLSAITKHYFDLTVPDQNGAFFNLLQHHGYPTPLLDWTYSPYVAAFFAFRNWPIGHTGKGKVRIYVFNRREWEKKLNQIQNLNPPFPHLSVMEFIAIDNPRLVPQQSVTTVTNLHDIESYVLKQEAITGRKFLEAYDLPASEREKAIADLRTMGITAGSMFPSVDGVCEELRERNFDQ